MYCKYTNIGRNFDFPRKIKKTIEGPSAKRVNLHFGNSGENRNIVIFFYFINIIS